MAAYADSEWVLMDTERMRPTKIEESLSGAYTLEPGLDMGSEEGKIRLPEQMESRDAFEVHEYHLDVNRHVNNGRVCTDGGRLSAGRDEDSRDAGRI